MVSQANLVLSTRNTSSSLSCYMSSKTSRNDDHFEEQSVSLSVDPTRYDSCSSVMSSEAAVGHNNCAGVSVTDPFMYGFLDSTNVCFATLMQQAYGSTLLQSDGGHSESVWYLYWKCII